MWRRNACAKSDSCTVSLQKCETLGDSVVASRTMCCKGVERVSTRLCERNGGSARKKALKCHC